VDADPAGGAESAESAGDCGDSVAVAAAAAAEFGRGDDLVLLAFSLYAVVQLKTTSTDRRWRPGRRTWSGSVRPDSGEPAAAGYRLVEESKRQLDSRRRGSEAALEAARRQAD
jgi:hypothetical protein